MGLSAFYRAVSLISGTLASLPMPSYRDDAGKREKVASIFDDPDGVEGQTVFEWKETAFAHLVLHGRCGALKVRTEAGALVRLTLVHPGLWNEELPTPEEIERGEVPAGGLWFRVQLDTGKSVKLDAQDFWYVPGLSLDGKTGVSLLTYARLSVATGIAGDRAAGNMFSRGALIAGLITPDDDQHDITDDVPEIRRQIDSQVAGYDNAGTFAILNRKLKLQPWTMTAVDAQFLQSRQFSIEEISRWTGVPPHLLMQVDKQTSWGTGVDEQNQGMSRYVLGHWAQRFEQRASRLLARPRWCEFDFAGLERPNFATEIDLLLKQVAGGLLTVDEARAVRNLPPMPKTAPAPDPAPDPEGDPNAGTE
jgi:HK97 family phage portal protein